MYKNPVYKWWEFTANLNWLAEFQDFWSINDVSFAAKVVGRDDQQYSPSDFWTMMIYQWYNVKSHLTQIQVLCPTGSNLNLSWKEKKIVKIQVFRDQMIKPEDFRGVSRLKVRSWGMCVMWCSWCHQQAISKTHRFPSISSAKNFTHQNLSEAAPCCQQGCCQVGTNPKFWKFPPYENPDPSYGNTRPS